MQIQNKVKVQLQNKVKVQMQNKIKVQVQNKVKVLIPIIANICQPKISRGLDKMFPRSYFPSFNQHFCTFHYASVFIFWIWIQDESTKMRAIHSPWNEIYEYSFVRSASLLQQLATYQWLHQSGEFTSVNKVSRIWLWISDNRATGPLGLDCYDTKIIFRCCSYLTFERSCGWPFWFSVTLNFYSKTAMVHFPLHCRQQIK